MSGARLSRTRPAMPKWVRRLLACSLLLFSLSLVALLLFRPRTEPLAVAVPEELPDWIQEALIPVNDWSRPGRAMTAMNGIVIHYIGNPGTSAVQNRNYFAGLARSHETYASSNFIIGLEGEVLLCVPMGEVAFASNDRNDDTLSIEVCHPDDTGEFTPESYAALVKLVRWLAEFYDLKEADVIRHYDIRGKECPRYFVQNPEAWEAFKAEVFAPADN